MKFTTNTAMLFLSQKDSTLKGAQWDTFVAQEFAKWSAALPRSVDYVGQQNLAPLNVRTVFFDDCNGAPTIRGIYTYNSNTDAREVRFNAEWLEPITE